MARDITVSPEGDLFYLFDDEWLSNGQNGRRQGRFASNAFDHISVGASNAVWLSGPGTVQAAHTFGLLFPGEPNDAKNVAVMAPPPAPERPGPYSPAVLADGTLQYSGSVLSSLIATIPGVTTAAFGTDTLWVGTTNGYFGLEPFIPHTNRPVRRNVPWPEVTALLPVEGGLWVGTTRGVFFERDGTNSRYATPSAPGLPPPEFRYYAGPRWLVDDHVVSLAADPDGNVWVLSRTGLSELAFRPTTLAAKADWFQRKLRARNLRFGLTAERRLTTPGDLTTSELVDTDNDGGWTSYYLGALAAQYAVTHDDRVRAWAWESFGALERLQELSTVPGFSARTIERRGFKFSDPDRWRPAADPGWDWKGHTSSDEICSQTFAHAVMWELVATNAPERARIATNYVRLVDHILAHNLYYVDVDGQPTLWGRWHPEYVNWFPHTIHDRRLNSAELTASLQLAFTMTGDARYRDKAFELFERHGYLTNIVSSMKLIGPTPGFVHQGNNMGDEWNHSDDELAFFTYWVLVRFAFDAELRAKYLAAVGDHWNLERPERYPIWNFIYAACGGTEFDPAGAVWTLRGTPLDTINWPMRNSHRHDVTRREPNFMGRELVELLPPGERLIARINTQPYILDQGDGTTDFPGDEFLLGYWLGRWVGAIGAPPAR